MQKLIFFFLLCCLNTLCFSQDTLILINGRRIITKTIDLKDNTIAYRKMDAKAGLKTIDPERVFSIAYRDGNERIIYQPDSLDPLDFKVEEMRNFIKGETDARDLYRNHVVKISGLAVGAGSALLTFYGLVGPPLFSTFLGAFSPNIEKELTFKVSGSAAETAGIARGKNLNAVTGTVRQPMFKEGQKLNLRHGSVRFRQDTNLDSAVALINSRFCSHRIHAASENASLVLYRSPNGMSIKDESYREGFEKRVRDYKIRNSMVAGLIGFIGSTIIYSIVFK